MSVRQRAVDLLYAMCDRSNAQQIVAEMLNYLETADYSIREEIVRYFQFLNFACLTLVLFIDWGAICGRNSLAMVLETNWRAVSLIAKNVLRFT